MSLGDTTKKVIRDAFASPKQMTENKLTEYENILKKASFQWTKRITLYDYIGAKWSSNYGNVQFKLTSGLWIDYENKRIAIRNAKLETASGAFIGEIDKWRGKKKEEEIPDIVSFNEIQKCDVLEGTKTKITGAPFGGVNTTDYSDGLSIRIITSGSNGTNSFQVYLLEKYNTMLGSGRLAQDNQNYKNCIACITAMSDELDNIIRMTQSSNQPSTADELTKFKTLLDNGTITQAEFDAKKKQLLGL